MKYISVSGTGYSGSGAVLDLLNEYDMCIDFCGTNDEFQFAYIPDGLDDLYYHLMNSKARFQSSDIAIKRFIELIGKLGKSGWNNKTNHCLEVITNDYCKSLIQVEWTGYWLFDLLDIYDKNYFYYKYRIERKINSIKAKFNLTKKDLIPIRPMYLSIDPDDFLLKTRLYLQEIILACNDYSLNENEYVILNQAVPANNPEHFMKYYDNIKVIIVYRDPRDTFLNIKKVNSINARWFPSDKIDDFVNYYKLMNKKVLGVNNNSNILYIKFEDLIYKYESTVSLIEDFLELKCMHKKPLSIFNPEKSIQNTQLFRYYRDFENEICIIEKELNDYLYDFDESININHFLQF